MNQSINPKNKTKKGKSFIFFSKSVYHSFKQAFKLLLLLLLFIDSSCLQMIIKVQAEHFFFFKKGNHFTHWIHNKPGRLLSLTIFQGESCNLLISRRNPDCFSLLANLIVER